MHFLDILQTFYHNEKDSWLFVFHITQDHKSIQPQRVGGKPRGDIVHSESKIQINDIPKKLYI